MTSTTIRTTCSSCELTADVRVTSLVLALPSPRGAANVTPSCLRRCVGCRTCATTDVRWRTAAYLLHAGATAITVPDADRIRPRYPKPVRPTPAR